MAWPHVFAALSTSPMSYLDDNFNDAAQLGTSVNFTQATIGGAVLNQSGNMLTVGPGGAVASTFLSVFVTPLASAGFAYFGFGSSGVGSQVGSITTNGTSTSYNTTSDAALKTVYGPADGTILSTLPVHDCAFTSDPTSRRPMVLAQELAAVCPWAVDNEADGPAMIDYSHLVATLIAYTQSLEARIVALESVTKLPPAVISAVAAAVQAALAQARNNPAVQAAIARGKGGSIAPP